MPEEKNVIGNINTVTAGNEFGIKSENSPFVESFYFADFYDDRACKRFIKTVERLIRTSREYNTYIENLRSNIHVLNHDNILSNIDNSDASLEFHHYPFTLYDIIEIVMLHHMAKNEKFTSFSVAKEVMELHFKHMIGIVSLSKTMHELAHSGNIFISANQIFGDYHKFMDEYGDGISAVLMNKVATMEQYTKDGIPSDFKGILEQD